MVKGKFVNSGNEQIDRLRKVSKIGDTVDTVDTVVSLLLPAPRPGSKP
jgi:hypothetical protein